jgi:hypothetical protein
VGSAVMYGERSGEWGVGAKCSLYYIGNEARK